MHDPKNKQTNTGAVTEAEIEDLYGGPLEETPEEEEQNEEED